MTTKRLFLSPPHIGGKELAFVREAFDSNYIAPLGPMVDAFEREFCEMLGVPHAVALSSGTAAMHLVLRYLGVGPGDEVFASTLTFIGSVSPIVFEGARPVFIDADDRSWNLDPDLLEEELDRCARRGKLPKAVVPTDLYGQSSDIKRLEAVCQAYEIPLIVDAAESLGATCNGHCAGAGGDAAVFSFNGNKIITTSGGGMLASRDKVLIEHARYLSQQARQPLPHYEHVELGYNYRMSNIVAAIGRGQLRCLADRVRRKREIFDYYQGALGDLPGISFMPEADYGRSNRWLTVMLVDPDIFGVDREYIRLALEAENIESRPVWKPMHMQPVFNPEVADNDHLPMIGKKRSHAARRVGGAVSERLFEKGLCLPSGTAMTEVDLKRVVGIIKGLCSEL
jgi:dTDP-4-amino-4,6-dideoxygalactose transaminase